LVHIFVCATALFAVCIYRLSQVSGSFRRAAAVLGGLFILLQLSRTVHTVARNAYEHEYASAGRYIREHSGPNSLIMGSAELAFVLGFSPNLVDDPSLGTYTGKVPSFFVYSDRYAMYFSRFRSRQPDVYEHVKTSLDQQYERVFEGPKYSVFARRNVTSSTSPGYVGKLTPNTLTQGKEAGGRRLE
jgi:hypothetical protein